METRTWARCEACGALMCRPGKLCRRQRFCCGHCADGNGHGALLISAMRGAPPSLDPQDLFVDLIYTVDKEDLAPILLFLGLNGESLEHIFQTSKTVSDRLLGVLYHILGSADK